MCGGFVGKVFNEVGNVADTFTRPIRKTAKKVVGTNVYNSVVRPVVKTGSNIAIGGLTGGPAGAIAAGVGGALTGSLNSSAYQPVNNIVLPAAAGYFTGTSEPGQAFNQYFQSGMDQGLGLGTSLKQAGLGAFDTIAAGGLSTGLNILDNGAPLLMSAFGGGGGGGGTAPVTYGNGGAIAPAMGALATNAFGGGANQQQQADYQNQQSAGFGNVLGVAPRSM